MPYNEAQTNRIRDMFLLREGAHEKLMFGSPGFFVHGNMCCGIWGELLVLRLGKDQAETALQLPNVRVMDITGKPMKGWVFVEPAGFKDDADLFEWLGKTYEFVSTLPRKH